MKRQLTLASNDLERFRKSSTRRETFLAEMNAVVPWAQLAAVIEPSYPKATSVGERPPVGLERLTCLWNFERFIPGKRLVVEGWVGTDGAA